MKQKKSKKGVAIGVTSVVLALAAIGSVTSGDKEPADDQIVEPPAIVHEAEVQEDVVISTAATLDELFLEVQNSISDAEAGSSTRVDAIAFYIKDIAAKQAIGDEAAIYIRDHYPDFYESTDLMERIMISGYYLEYMSSEETVTSLGMDTVQAVKYVYRGAETVENAATQENLRQVGEVLQEVYGLEHETSEVPDLNETAPNTEEPTYAAPAPEMQIIGNINSKKYHKERCGFLPDAENQTIFASAEEAEANGYSPCGHCH